MSICSNSSGIQVEANGSTAVITFDRPDKRNPLSERTVAAIKFAIADLENDASIKSCIFTGTGAAFASGANLHEVSALDRKKATKFALLGQELMRGLASSRLTILAAINGYCMGGALDLALACDKRLAVAEAKFAHPGASLGIITGWGGTQMLPKLIGRKRALEMFLTARRVGAAEALDLGLIDEISNNPLNRALELCGGSQ